MKCSMGIVIFFLVVLVTTANASVQDFYTKVATPDPVSVECLAKHCLEQAGSCALDSNCRSAILCAKKCFEMWDNDTTNEKVHVQNCTNICAFTYRGKAYDNFMKCVGDNQCARFPPIPSQCRAPGKLTLLKKLPAKVLEGSWWVVKGLHPVYDCYPCQHLEFKQLNSTLWSYTPKYQVYLANGSLGLIEDTYTFPNTTPGDNISFEYHDVGLSHSETWWLFDEADDKSYILLYYCGNALQWYYDGALVLSREKSLPDSDVTKIAASYSKAVGLDIAKFCNTSTKQCPD